MISHLVSSILNPGVVPGVADKSTAQPQDDDRNRPIIGAGVAARPVAARLNRASVYQSGAGERIDYFHAAKKMLRTALSDFNGGVQESFAEIGLDGEATERFAKAMMRQTKNALLWGVGFSVKLMTATVSEVSDADGDTARPTFNIMARSIEIRINHSDGVIDVSTGSVSIESQFAGGPGAPPPHLVDIRDTGGQSTASLTSAMQALQDPQTLFADMEDEAEDAKSLRLDADRLKEIEKGLPRIQTPRVLSRPDYNSRILLSEMDHFRNDQDDLVTYIRLDALIPLTDKPAASPAETVTLPPPTRVASG